MRPIDLAAGCVPEASCLGVEVLTFPLQLESAIWLAIRSGLPRKRGGEGGERVGPTPAEPKQYAYHLDEVFVVELESEEDGLDLAVGERAVERRAYCFERDTE